MSIAVWRTACRYSAACANRQSTLQLCPIFHNFRAPIEDFAEYGLILNIRVPWMLFIITWHAFFSVVFPITIVQRLQPQKADVQWLSLKATWGLAIPVFALASVQFFTRTEEDLTMRLIHYGFLIVAVIVIWFVAGKLPRSPHVATPDDRSDFSWRPLFAGAAYSPLLFIPVILAENKIPYILCILYFAVIVVLSVFAIGRRKETTRNRVLLFGLGAATIQTLLGVVYGFLLGDLVSVAVSAVFAVIFIAAVILLKQKAHVQKALQTA